MYNMNLLSYYYYYRFVLYYFTLFCLYTKREITSYGRHVSVTASCQGYDLQSWREERSIWWFALRAPWWSHTQWNYSMPRPRERGDWVTAVPLSILTKPPLTLPVFISLTFCFKGLESLLKQKAVRSPLVLDGKMVWGILRIQGWMGRAKDQMHRNHIWGMPYRWWRSWNVYRRGWCSLVYCILFFT